MLSCADVQYLQYLAFKHKDAARPPGHDWFFVCQVRCTMLQAGRKARADLKLVCSAVRRPRATNRWSPASSYSTYY